MDAMEKLNYLSLLSKVCTELDSHIGTSGRVLAEFVIKIGRKCNSVDEFDNELRKFGAEFHDYFVRTLLNVIHAIFPPKSKCNVGVSPENDGGGGRKRREKWKRSVYDELELCRVYKGRVSRINDGCCFVRLLDFEGVVEGLVHVTQMSRRRRIAKPEDVVKIGQKVYVKVVSKSREVLSLSMSDVDQNTGLGLVSTNKGSRDGGLSLNRRDVEEDSRVMLRRPLKRMSSPEIWEMKQLVASGALSLKDVVSFRDEGDGVVCHNEGPEEDFEIELNEDEPAFLRGKTREVVDMSPVKAFRNSEGSLSQISQILFILEGNWDKREGTKAPSSQSWSNVNYGRKMGLGSVQQILRKVR